MSMLAIAIGAILAVIAGTILPKDRPGILGAFIGAFGQKTKKVGIVVAIVGLTYLLI